MLRTIGKDGRTSREGIRMGSCRWLYTSRRRACGCVPPSLVVTRSRKGSRGESEKQQADAELDLEG